MVESLAREDDLDDESYQIRHVYSWFGLAAYQGQVLETGLLNVLTLAQTSATADATRQTFDEFFEGNLKATMGKLITLLKPFLMVGDDLLGLLAKALAERNRLAHHFFRDHDKDFISFSGREAMLAELMLARDLFDEVDERLAPVKRRLIASRGIDEAAEARLLQEVYESRLREAISADDD
jgi:hypothetical protein